MKQQLIAALEKAARYITVYRCPVCGSGFSSVRGSSIYCENGHCFDFSAEGYVNFLTKPVRDKYSATLYSSRREVMQSSVYASLRHGIADALASVCGIILDAGAGEGALTFAAHTESRELFGIDISKNGIKYAAKAFPGLWSVGDIARLPYADGAFDAVLNVLSPANYSEFARVLKKGGLLVKVIPGRDYLRELREAVGLYEYEESGAKDIFCSHCDAVSEIRINETHAPGAELMRKILDMSPIGWQRENGSLPENVTVDLTIISGKIKN